MLKKRIKDYLEATGVSKTKFCVRIQLSTRALSYYLNDQLKLSLETEERIKNYLAQFNF